jgi:hypothetical protein
MLCQNHFAEKIGMFWLLDFPSQGHILITNGAALSGAKGGGDETALQKRGSWQHCKEVRCNLIANGWWNCSCMHMLRASNCSHHHHHQLERFSNNLGFCTHLYCKLPCFLKWAKGLHKFCHSLCSLSCFANKWIMFLCTEMSWHKFTGKCSVKDLSSQCKFLGI